MAARYEVVEGPEAMEVVDDGVYHPDVTLSSTTNSFRTLEPILDGPVDLKAIFWNPRWSFTQKRICLGLVTVVSTSCLILLICLLIGLSNTIQHIDEKEKLKKSGLFVVPTAANDIHLFVYNFPNKSEKYRLIIDSYIDEIERHLADYKNQSATLPDCAQDERLSRGRMCKFSLSWLGTNCTKDNQYGYYTGSPCLLFGMKELNSWTPDITPAFLHEKIKERISDRRIADLDVFHTPLACSTSTSFFGSFDQAAKIENKEFSYYPSAGFNNVFIQQMTQEQRKALPPLVFVQLNDLHKVDHLYIECSLLAANVDKLEGVQSIKLEYMNSSSENDLLLDGA